MIDYSRYLEMIAKINSGANTLWNKISFIAVAEVLNREIDLRTLSSSCDSMKDTLTAIRRMLSKEVDSMSDEQFDQEEGAISQVEDAIYKVDNKLDAIEDVLSELSDLSAKSDDENYSSLFGDIQSINLGESRNFIKLSRLN